MAIATLTVDLVAKLANLERDMGKAAHIAEKNARRMESAFNGVKTSLAAIGSVLTVGVFAGMVRGVADAGDQLQKLSTKTGDAVEELSKLQYAASLSDLSNEDLGASLIKLNKVMGEAANGSKEAAAALARFGIVPNSGLSAVAAFKQIADRVKATGDETKIASGLNDVFGKSFSSLIPLLKGGSEELTKAGDELERMGGVMSGELAKSSEQFNDNLTKIGASLNALKTESLGGAISGLEELTSKMVQATTAAGGFWKGLATWATTSGDQESDPGKAIAEITRKLNVLKETKQGLEAPTIANKLGFNSEDILIVNKQISVLTTQLEYLKGVNSSAAGSYKDRWLLPTPASEGIAGTPAPAKTTSRQGSAEKVAELTASTRDYQAAMESLRTTLINADSATQNLDAAQEALHKLMTGSEWATYPEAMKWAAIEQASFASGAITAASAQDRLNQLMADTPTAELERATKDAELLEQALSNAGSAADYKKIKEALEGVYQSASKGNEKLEEQNSLAKDLGMSFSSAFEDAIVKGEEFSDVLQGLYEDILRILVRKNITEPLANSVSSFDFGSLFSGIFGGLTGARASGGPVSSGGTYLVGEKGPELLRMGGNGHVTPNNALGSNVQVNIIESPGSGKSGTTQTSESGGKTIIDVFVEQVKGAIAKDIGSGGMVAGAMESQYGLNRAAGAWR